MVYDTINILRSIWSILFYHRSPCYMLNLKDTRMRSSRMRTVRSSGRRVGGGEYPSMRWAGGCIEACTLQGGDVIARPTGNSSYFIKEIASILVCLLLHVFLFPFVHCHSVCCFLILLTYFFISIHFFYYVFHIEYHHYSYYNTESMCIDCSSHY